MPSDFEVALTEKITRMNVAKEGATTYYVDGVTGNDGANGLTWESAKKTVMGAVDIADSWADIYLKAATYPEKVTVPSSQEGLSLIGEHQASTIVGSGAAAGTTGLNIEGDYCTVTRISVKGHLTTGAIITSGEYLIIEDIVLLADTADSRGIYVYGAKYSVISGVVATSANINDAIYVSHSGGTQYCEIKGCKISNCSVDAIKLRGQDLLVHDNTISSCNAGIDISNHSLYSTVYHNNLIGNAVQIDDDAVGGPTAVFENFYDDHTNVDNGSGIADAPYAIAGVAGNSDPRPVIVRNGWLAAALSGVNASTINAKQYEAVTNRTAGTETFAAVNTEYNLIDLDGEATSKAYAGRLKVRLAQGHTYIIHKYTQVNAGGMDEVGSGVVVNTAASEKILDGFTFKDTETIRYTIECDSVSGQCDYEYAYAARGE